MPKRLVGSEPSAATKAGTSSNPPVEHGAATVNECIKAVRRSYSQVDHEPGVAVLFQLYVEVMNDVAAWTPEVMKNGVARDALWPIESTYAKLR